MPATNLDASIVCNPAWLSSSWWYICKSTEVGTYRYTRTHLCENFVEPTQDEHVLCVAITLDSKAEFFPGLTQDEIKSTRISTAINHLCAITFSIFSSCNSRANSPLATPETSSTVSLILKIWCASFQKEIHTQRKEHGILPPNQGDSQGSYQPHRVAAQKHYSKFLLIENALPKGEDLQRFKYFIEMASSQSLQEGVLSKFNLDLIK